MQRCFLRVQGKAPFVLKNITVNNIPFFSRIVIRFIILNCELFVTRIQDFVTGMYMETKEMDDNMVIKRR